METLLVQYKDFIILLGQLAIFTFALLLGYVLGRNSSDKPVVSVPTQKPAKAPFHDDFPSVYDDALQDKPDERVSTI